MFGNQGPDKIMHQKTNNQNFQCNAAGTPTPVYRWMKNGLFTGGNVTDKKLSLRGLDVHHSGVYQCIAANDHGAVLGQRETLSVTCKYLCVSLSVSDYLYVCTTSISIV